MGEFDPIYTWREEIDTFGFDGDKLPSTFHALRGTMLAAVWYDKQPPSDEVIRSFPSRAQSQSFIMVAALASIVFETYPELRWVKPADIQPKKFKIIQAK